jgi:hypothetical protein
VVVVVLVVVAAAAVVVVSFMYGMNTVPLFLMFLCVSSLLYICSITLEVTVDSEPILQALISSEW